MTSTYRIDIWAGVELHLTSTNQSDTRENGGVWLVGLNESSDQLFAHLPSVTDHECWHGRFVCLGGEISFRHGRSSSGGGGSGSGGDGRGDGSDGDGGGDGSDSGGDGGSSSGGDGDRGGGGGGCCWRQAFIRAKARVQTLGQYWVKWPILIVGVQPPQTYVSVAGYS